MIRASALALPGRLAPTDLTLEAGTMTALIGPNGGGKTSLLRALACLEGTTGETIIAGEPLRNAPPARRQQLIGLLPASRHLAWPIAVRDLLRLGSARVDEARLAALVAALELEPLHGRASNALSTGERARVLLARALGAAPALLLLDEPLSNLDPYWVLRTMALLVAEKDRGAALLVALHDLAQLPAFDRAILVDDGQVVADGAPERLVSSNAFEQAFRVGLAADGTIRLPAGPRSSP